MAQALPIDRDALGRLNFETFHAGRRIEWDAQPAEEQERWKAAAATVAGQVGLRVCAESAAGPERQGG